MNTKSNVIESRFDFIDGDTENPLVIKRSQEIPKEFLDDLAEARHMSTQGRMANYHKAASIPAALHEAWLRQGYDCTKEPIRKTLQRLREEQLDAFIATERQL